jgi:hypothetical protein
MMVDNQEIRFLGDIQRISLKEGDALVISSPDKLSIDDCKAIRDFASIRFPKNEVIVLSGGLKIGVVGKE